VVGITGCLDERSRELPVFLDNMDALVDGMFAARCLTDDTIHLGYFNDGK
jgi:hypothetical protein